MECPENRQKYKLSKRKYEKTKKGNMVSRLKTHRRRCHVDKKLKPQQLLDIMLKFNNKCFNCGATEHLAFDHHVPLSKGGVFEVSNITILCRTCNGLKSGNSPEDFYTHDKLTALIALLALKPI